MGFMPALSAIMLSLLIGALPTIGLGLVMQFKGWMQSIPGEHRMTSMYCAWALFSILIFTAINHQNTFWG